MTEGVLHKWSTPSVIYTPKSEMHTEKPANHAILENKSLLISYFATQHFLTQEKTSGT